MLGGTALALSDHPAAKRLNPERYVGATLVTGALDDIFGPPTENLDYLTWARNGVGASLWPDDGGSLFPINGRDGTDSWRLVLGQVNEGEVVVNRPYLEMLVSPHTHSISVHAEPGMFWPFAAKTLTESQKRYEGLLKFFGETFGARFEVPTPTGKMNRVQLEAHELKGYLVSSLDYVRQREPVVRSSLLESFVMSGMLEEQASVLISQLDIRRLAKNIEHGKNPSSLCYVPGRGLVHAKLIRQMNEYRAAKRATQDFIRVCPAMGDIIQPSVIATDISLDGVAAGLIVQKYLPPFTIGASGVSAGRALKRDVIRDMVTLADMHVMGTYAMYVLGYSHQARDPQSPHNKDRIDKVEYHLHKHHGFPKSESYRERLYRLGLTEGMFFIHNDLTDTNIRADPEDRAVKRLIDTDNSGFGNFMRDIATALSRYYAHSQGELTDKLYRHYLQTYIDRLRHNIGEKKIDDNELNVAYDEFQLHQMHHVMQNSANIINRVLTKKPILKSQSMTLVTQLSIRRSLEDKMRYLLPKFENGMLWSHNEMAKVRYYIAECVDARRQDGSGMTVSAV